MVQGHGRQGSRRRPGAVVAVIALALVLAPLHPAAALRPPADRPPPRGPAAAGDFVPGRLLVGVAPGQGAAARAQVEQRGGRVVRTHAPGGLLVVETPAHTGPPAFAQALRGRPGVRFAEPDYVITAEHHVVPDDPLWPELWGLDRIDASTAWHDTTGSAAVVVGIMDSGIDYTHPDLADRIWHNPAEIPGNGVDDDGNGWVDDVHGADCRNGDGDPMDDYWHGTHVAGTVGAAGDNGLGVVGVNWDVRLMGLKMLGANGSASVLDAVTCFDYAIDQGVRVTNVSWALGSYSEALYDAVGRAKAAGQLVVAAAGNQGSDTDTFPRYPAAFDHDNVVSVASSGPDDALAGDSNYGAVTVDLAAPGVGILSTDLTTYGLYYVSSGTSMAAPHVTGVAALLLALDPALPYSALRDHILAGVEVVPGLDGKVASGGRLDAAGAVASLLDPGGPEGPAAPAGLAVTDPGVGRTLELAWEAGAEPDPPAYRVYRATGAAGPWEAVAEGLADPAHTDTGLTDGTTYHYQVTAVDAAGNESPPSGTASGTPTDVTPPAPPAGLVAVAGEGEVALAWDAGGEDDLAGYLVDRTTAPPDDVDRTWATVATTAVAAHTDTDVTAGGTYYYAVRARDHTGNTSDASAEAAATPHGPDPDPPPHPTSTTYTVSSVTVVRGTAQGSISALAEADGVYYQVTSERRGAQQWLEVQASATVEASDAGSVTITWRRSFSSPVEESFSVYAHTGKKWQELSGTVVGTDDETLTWTAATPADVVGPSGEVLVRLTARQPSAYTVRADQLVFTVEH